MPREHSHRLLTAITALWLIGVLAARIQMLAAKTGYPFLTAAFYFLPEIIVAAIFMILLPSVWDRMRWTSSALMALAALLLILLWITTFSGLWFVSFLLLLFLAYVLRSDAAPAHPAMWLVLVVSKLPLYLGTPGAYLQLCAGAIGALEGFRQGHWLLATILLICSVLGLYGLWTMWSISTRAWAHGRYVVHSERGRAKDARGLLAAWLAVIGLAAISPSIFRTEDVIAFSVLLVPTLLVTSAMAVLMAPEVIGEAGRPSLFGVVRRSSIRQYVGIACGIVVGVLCIMPAARMEYGFCGLVDMFPIEGDLWPKERGMVFGLYQQCSTGPLGQTFQLGMASLVFWGSGWLASVVGRSRDAWLGAIAAAVTAFIVLAWSLTTRVIAVLAFDLNPLPPVSYYIHWWSTIGIAIAVVLWAARLGYIGARRGAQRVERPSASAERGGHAGVHLAPHQPDKA